MKRAIMFFVFGLIVFILSSAIAQTAATCSSARDKLLRFHVTANSNTKADQEIKLKVRDRIIEKFQDVFKNSANKKDATAKISAMLELIEAEAQKVLDENNYTLLADAKISIRSFPKCVYGDITLPSGEYEALTITLGEGKGKNFFCVMFPPICTVGGAVEPSAKDSVYNTLNRDEFVIVTSDSPTIKIKLKITELFERLIKEG